MRGVRLDAGAVLGARRELLPQVVRGEAEPVRVVPPRVGRFWIGAPRRSLRGWLRWCRCAAVSLPCRRAVHLNRLVYHEERN